MKPRHLHIDGETRSGADLKKTGAHRYFEDPTTDVLCIAYAFDMEEPKLWMRGEPCPPEIVEHVEAGGRIYAWNVAFERSMWRAVLGPRYGWPDAGDEQFYCTMSEAMVMNLPGRLDQCGPAIGAAQTKDKEGHRLMLQMCKPRKLRKNEACPSCGDRMRECFCGPYWHETPEKLERLAEYCMQDVRTEQAIANFVLPLRPDEQRIFFLDAKINDRGVFIDKELCEASQGIVDKAMEKLDAEIEAVTLGEVGACTNTAQLVRWLKSCGVDTDSVAKDVLEDLLIRDDLPVDCRRALELRQEGSKTSVAKIFSMLSRRQKDGRMRGNLQYYGASATGRWAARGTQLQNLVRAVMIAETRGEKLSQKELERRVALAIDTIIYGSLPLMEVMYGKPLTVISDCVRPMICAPKGFDLLAADFANIEGRGNAWQAGQEDKLEAFREYDNGTGPDLYLVAASGIFGVSVADAKPFRQIGKVAELALGYQGGPRAFAKMAKTYGLKMDNQRDIILEAAATSHKEQAEENYAQRGKGTGMAKESWIAAEVIKLAWRAKNWRIAASWNEVEECAIKAMNKPKEIFETGCVKFRYVKPFLFCRLPSGRALCYPFARLEESKTPWGDMRQKIIYKSVDQFTKKWGDKAYYGGLGVENIVQALSRDIMAEAMLRTEAAGYKTILTVHDEIVAEVAEDFGSLDEFANLMTQNPPWAQGMPITAAGWRGKRYRKG